MTIAELKAARLTFVYYLLGAFLPFTFAVAGFGGVVMHPNRPLPVTVVCLLLGLLGGVVCVYCVAKAFAQLRKMRCPGCKQLLSARIDLVSKTGKCPICGQQILSNVSNET